MPTCRFNGVFCFKFFKISTCFERVTQYRPRPLTKTRFKIIDQCDKRRNTFCASTAHTSLSCTAQRQCKRNLLTCGKSINTVNCCVANAALGHIQNAFQADFVKRVCRATNICERIFDFASVVEPRTANNFVGHTRLHQTLFKHTALRIGAIKHSHLTPLARVGLMHLFELRDRPICFVIFIIGVKPHNTVAFAEFCPEFFGFTLGIIGYHRISSI